MGSYGWETWGEFVRALEEKEKEEERLRKLSVEDWMYEDIYLGHHDLQARIDKAGGYRGLVSAHSGEWDNSTIQEKRVILDELRKLGYGTYVVVEFVINHVSEPVLEWTHIVDGLTMLLDGDTPMALAKAMRARGWPSSTPE